MSGQALTIRQISAALSLTKADPWRHIRLPREADQLGTVKSRLGPASSTKGVRYVKCYRVPRPKPPPPIVVAEIDARRAMAFSR